jgi:high-affinity K+ transport system ATPase subunit B
VVTLLLGLGLLGVVCWVTTQSALTAYRYQRVSVVMLYALWPAMLLIPTGLALMAVAMLATLGRQVRAALGPRAGRAEVGGQRNEA